MDTPVSLLSRLLFSMKITKNGRDSYLKGISTTKLTFDSWLSMIYAVIIIPVITYFYKIIN